MVHSTSSCAGMMTIDLMSAWSLECLHWSGSAKIRVSARLHLGKGTNTAKMDQKLLPNWHEILPGTARTQLARPLQHVRLLLPAAKQVLPGPAFCLLLGTPLSQLCVVLLQAPLLVQHAAEGKAEQSFRCSAWHHLACNARHKITVPSRQQQISAGQESSHTPLHIGQSTGHSSLHRQRRPCLHGLNKCGQRICAGAQLRHPVCALVAELQHNLVQEVGYGLRQLHPGSGPPLGCIALAGPKEIQWQGGWVLGSGSQR